MTYQALARKWRPRSFDQLVGQEHIVAALTHALDSDRVHHGFLFTGTRGIGKTTLARILAKCLNCEEGVSSSPCNECNACRAIDEGRFVDLIEVDAASRTQVADTRELLDNVQYAPTSGRFKVYLVDEVHMLSTHSFNALLKTLEEPPPHVKFLFATTDPHKLPVTILSRCLQFNLRLLRLEEIQAQLTRILESEAVAFEEDALRLLARSADGSMRDGLSLLDQAIAQGGGRVSAETVRQMLGLIDADYVRDLIEALARSDTQAAFAVVDAVGKLSNAYAQLLDDLLRGLFHLSLYKRSAELLEAKQELAPWHSSVADMLEEEDLQLYYQIAMIGKRDLPLSPDPRTGFEMLILRLLAFQPEGRARRSPGDAGPQEPSRSADAGLPAGAAPSGAAAAEDDWPGLARQLALQSWAQELAMNLALRSRENGVWVFELSPQHEHLVNEERVDQVSKAITRATGERVEVKIRLSESAAETPVQSMQRERSDRQRQAEEAIRNDPDVQDLIEQFDATLMEDSIRSRR